MSKGGPAQITNCVQGGSSSNHKLCPGGFELKPKLCPRGSRTNHIRFPGESGTEKMCISSAQITNCVQGGLG